MTNCQAEARRATPKPGLKQLANVLFHIRVNGWSDNCQAVLIENASAWETAIENAVLAEADRPANVEQFKRELSRFQCSAHIKTEIERFIDHLASLGTLRTRTEECVALARELVDLYAVYDRKLASAKSRSILMAADRVVAEADKSELAMLRDGGMELS